MQHDRPLTIQFLLNRMRSVNAASVVTTLRSAGSVHTATYGEVASRTESLAAALRDLGVGPGDRVATLMWNTQEHLELYLAVPAMGAVLHTLNLRLHPEQLIYIANHAEDKIIFVSDSLVPLLASIMPSINTIEHVVVVGDGPTDELGDVIRYEPLLGSTGSHYDYPDLDERSAAALCYTSGTTGNPKGVLYSHKSTMLHAMGAAMADTFGICSNDRILPIVPMFHVNAWGLPYAAALTGADLVMPSQFLQAELLVHLIESERVTVAAGVPTIWHDILRYADDNFPDLSSLRMVPCGGSAVPRSLIEAFEHRHGVRLVQAWGMTETSPLGAVAIPPAGIEGEAAWDFRTSAGRVCPLVDVRIVADDGSELPWDGKSTGEMEVRGQWIASAYYRDAAPEKFHDGWLRTGDVAAIAPGGYIRITDRAKDVIKSGGEWISSLAVENELVAHAGVLEAAVIAKPHDRWGERPLACIVFEPGRTEVTADELAAHLSDRIASWWIPEDFAFIDAIPKTSVGKFDKKVLRRMLADGDLNGMMVSTK
jgi:fatty-acyl-CoA synthase